LHPDYASTRYAIARAKEAGTQCVGVQHHHAHMASCMAENGLMERVIGVTFDGTGYGLDGAIWGGEFLIGDYASFKRAAHLRYVALPGGESAVREPWRMAVAHLLDADAHCTALEQRIGSASIRLIRTMIARRLNSPMTSSAGRLFDAVAALIGIRDRVSYEGQAAMQLEWAAGSIEAQEPYPFELDPAARAEDAALVVDTRPIIRAICRDMEDKTTASIISRRFHSTLARMIFSVCMKLRTHYRVEAVVLSGGTFMNAILTIEATTLLEGNGFRVYRHKLVPSNDGGLSLGQLAVAAARSEVAKT
jgi:hydrogenase maturation protein HypF